MKKQARREELGKGKGDNETLAQQGRDQGKEKIIAQVKRSKKTVAAAKTRRGGGTVPRVQSTTGVVEGCRGCGQADLGQSASRSRTEIGPKEYGSYTSPP